MANLHDLQKRIDSVQATKQVTRTMEMVSSAKIGRSTRRMYAGRPYAEAISRMLHSLSEGGGASSSPLLSKHGEVKSAIIIAVASDRGLAGGFNSNVMRICDQIKLDLEQSEAEVSFITCGKKATAWCAYRNYPIVKDYAGLSADPTLDEARDIANICTSRYLEGSVDEVYLVYNHTRNAADQDLIQEKILPIEALPTAEAGDEETEAEADFSYDFEPDANTVLSELVPSYFVNAIYAALVDSAAAEQGARRKAMKAATDNATDMIDSLSRIYNRLRQENITTEMTEIISGAQAAEE